MDKIQILKENIERIRNFMSGSLEPEEITKIREYKSPTTQIKVAQDLIVEIYDYLIPQEKKSLNELLSGTRGDKKKFWKILKEKHDKIK